MIVIRGKSFLFGIAFGAVVLLGSACCWPGLGPLIPGLGQWSRVHNQHPRRVVTVLHPDPFRDIDRLAAQLLGTSPGSARVPLAMPMDLYRSGDHYVLHADLPGVDPNSVDVSVDGGILTVTAQRSERTEHDVQWRQGCDRDVRSDYGPGRNLPGKDRQYHDVRHH